MGVIDVSLRTHSTTPCVRARASTSLMSVSTNAGPGNAA